MRANRMVGHAAMTLTYTTSTATEKLFQAIIEDRVTRGTSKGWPACRSGADDKNLSEKVLEPVRKTPTRPANVGRGRSSKVLEPGRL